MLRPVWSQLLPPRRQWRSPAPDRQAPRRHPRHSSTRARSKPKPKDKLGQHDRELLTRAQQKGDKRVTVILATEKGSTASVVQSIKAAGGWISLTSDRLGYVSASVPTGSVDGLAKSAAILAVDLNESIPLPRPEAASAGSASTAAVAAPGRGHAGRQPLHADPRHRVGGVQVNTAWDGRGVTVGVIDSGVDLDHPALQTTSTGERKIVDWVTGTHPLLEGDGSWRAMLTSVTGPTFTYAGATWTAPEGSTRSTGSRRASPRTAMPPGTSTGTATRPMRGACSTTRRPTTSGWTPTRTAPSRPTR